LIALWKLSRVASSPGTETTEAPLHLARQANSLNKIPRFLTTSSGVQQSSMSSANQRHGPFHNLANFVRWMRRQCDNEDNKISKIMKIMKITKIMKIN
jgi:hypothetical protein